MFGTNLFINLKIFIISNITTKPKEVEDLEKITKRLAELKKEGPRTLVAIRYGYGNETFISVGFTNNDLLSDKDTITLDNGINELPLHTSGDNFVQVYISKSQFLDYCLLDKKEEQIKKSRKRNLYK